MSVDADQAKVTAAQVRPLTVGAPGTVGACVSATAAALRSLGHDVREGVDPDWGFLPPLFFPRWLLSHGWQTERTAIMRETEMTVCSDHEKETEMGIGRD